MIALVFAMVWRRRGQAVTLALLSMFAVASAVAAPAFLRAAERAVAVGQVATALPAERGLRIGANEDSRDGDGSGTGFSSIGTALAGLPGFDYIYAAEFPAIGLEPTNIYRTRFVYRQKVCEHLTMATGRCLIGEGDVVVGVQTAKRLKLAAGDSITLRYSIFNPNPSTPGFVPRGDPKKLTIAGTYTVPDRVDTYWGAHGYFSLDPGNRPGEPVFTGKATLDAFDHGATDLSIDGAARPEALADANLGGLRAGLQSLTEMVATIGPTVSVSTQLPALLDRIDSGRAAAGLIVPLLAAPLVLLACLSIFLAVGYGTEGRRPELAVVALRGLRLPGRWLLAVGESLVAIVVGSLLGCLVGQLLVNLVASVRFPGVQAAGGLDSLRYAPAAALAALLAAVLAQSRQLLSPVAELLRRAPAVPRSARALAVEAGIALLAVVTCVQLYVSHGSLTGLGLVATAFLILALALIAARALLPVITRIGVRALRRGRLGAALAGFQLSRRPGAARLFALLVAAVAVAGYATAAVDVAARGRDVTAQLGVGAHRVVSLQYATRQQLLTVTHTLDPNGDFAMGVARLPGGGPNEPAGLAVDSPRLAKVANWPAVGPTADQVAGILHPAAPEAYVFPGQDLDLDVTVTGLNGSVLRIFAVVAGLSDLGDATVSFGSMSEGRHHYQQRVPACRDKCRLNAIGFSTAEGGSGVSAQVTVHRIGSTGVLTEPGSPDRWRITQSGQLSAAADGLRVDLDAPGGLPGGTFLQPVDTPYPLPVASAGQVKVDGTINGLDGKPVPADRAIKIPVVPQTGTHAALVDLEYADRLSTDGSPAVGPQIWLTGRAPADILDRLADQGLIVTDDVTEAQVRRQLDEQGPALALWFYVLAGVLAVALAAGALVLAASVDRARRVEDLAALRAQGLGRRAVRQATLWTYPLLVVAAVLAGVVIAAAAWWLTGWALPLAGIEPPDLPLPAWPQPLVAAAVAVAVLAVLACVASVTGRRTLKEIP